MCRWTTSARYFTWPPASIGLCRCLAPHTGDVASCLPCHSYRRHASTTLHALYAGHFLRDPPIDANYTMCMQRSVVPRRLLGCARYDGTARPFRGRTPAVRRQAADVYLCIVRQIDLRRAQSAALSLNRSAALPSRDGTCLRQARYLLQAACHNMSWKPSQRDCSVARMPSTSSSGMRSPSSSGETACSTRGQHAQHHHNREPFLAAIDRFLWQPGRTASRPLRESGARGSHARRLARLTLPSLYMVEFTVVADYSTSRETTFASDRRETGSGASPGGKQVRAA